MNTAKQGPADIFISYSQHDEQWLKRLRVHLQAVEREKDIFSFSDRDLRPGDNWLQRIRDAMDSARVAVLLVSADFLASEFIRTHELPKLLAKAMEDGVVIMPIIVSPSLFDESAELSQFFPLNPEQPLIAMETWEQEQLFVKACKAIMSAITHHRVGPVPAVPDSAPGEPPLEAAATAAATDNSSVPETVTFESESEEPPQPVKPLSASDREKILERIHESLRRVVGQDQNLFVAPDIPERKLDNARAAFRVPDSEPALALIDCTVLGSARVGLIVSTSGVYGRNDWAAQQPGAFAVGYSELAKGPIQPDGWYEVRLGPTAYLNCAGGPGPEFIAGLLQEIAAHAQQTGLE